MKKSILYLGVIAVVSSCKSIPADVNNYAGTITADQLKEKLYTYASDEFEGRETGKPGQKKAVEYLKNHYVNLNIPSPIAEGDYFQEVPLQTIGTPNLKLTVNGKSFNYFDDIISMTGAAKTSLEVDDIVYAGFGITDDKHNDYKDLNVKGKIVVIKEGEPQNADGTYKITGTTSRSTWSNGRQALTPKREAAKNAGAKAVFFMSNSLFARYATFFKRSAESGGSRRLTIVGGETPLHHFMISETLGKALVSNIDKEDKTALIKTKVTLDYEPVSTKINSENVAAVIKGTEKPDEYIVISAHLDHEGIKEGEVYNGADDDGSGTVAVLEIAEAFKAAAEKGHGPKRSILFLHVTAEEKGLLGSRYYADEDPIVPLENTIVDLNIDMIGRIDPKRDSSKTRNYVYLIGSDKLSTELHQISEDINTKYTNLELDYTYNDENHPDRIYYRSDHWNFAKNNIPVIFYFNGTHDDYHRPSDTPDKIEYDLLENRTRLVFYTAWELANRDKRIEADKAVKQ